MSKIQKIEDTRISNINDCLARNQKVLDFLEQNRISLIQQYVDIGYKLGNLESTEYKIELDSEKLEDEKLWLLNYEI